MAQYEDDIEFWREHAIPQFAVAQEMCRQGSWKIEHDTGKLQYDLLYGGDLIYPGYMVMIIERGGITRTGMIVKRQHLGGDVWRFYVDLPPLDNKDG
jgi:hypothetical protein